MSIDAWLMLAILILMLVLLIWDRFPAWLVYMGTISVCPRRKIPNILARLGHDSYPILHLY